MHNDSDEKLDNLLRSRRVEPANPDLAQRIIFKARQRPQNRSVSLWQWMHQFCAELNLPTPAYVLAGALILGTVIGFSLPPNRDSNGYDSNSSIQSFFAADEALL